MDCPSKTLGRTRVQACHDHLDITVGATDKVAVLVRRQQGYVADVGVDQLDAQKGCSLCLHVGPSRHTAVAALDELAGFDRIASSVEHILAQEDLVRRMRGIGLVLVDKRRRRVYRAIGIVRRFPMTPSAPGPAVVARVSTMKLAGSPVDIERIVRQQRNEDRAATAFGNEIEPMIEKLAKQREPGVEWSRQPFVRGNVGQNDVRTLQFYAAVCEQQHESIIG